MRNGPCGHWQGKDFDFSPIHRSPGESESWISRGFPGHGRGSDEFRSDKDGCPSKPAGHGGFLHGSVAAGGDGGEGEAVVEPIHGIVEALEGRLAEVSTMASPMVENTHSVAATYRSCSPTKVAGMNRGHR